MYHQEEFTCKLSGAVSRDVNCEKCGCRYQYQLGRTVTGRGVSPYSFNNDGAIQRAKRQAERRLEKVLQTAVDPVRCPECGWLQADMVREIRCWRFSNLRAIAIVILLFSLACMGVIGAILATFNDTSKTEWLQLLLWTGTPAALAAAALVVRVIVVNASDPNKGYPQRFGDRALERVSLE